MEDKMAAGAFGRAWSYGCEYIFKIFIIPPPLRNRLNRLHLEERETQRNPETQKPIQVFSWRLPNLLYFGIVFCTD